MVPHENADGGIAESPNDPPRQTRSEPHSQGIRQSPDDADRKRPPRPHRVPKDRNRERSIPAELTNRRYLDVRLFCNELRPRIAEDARKRRICDLEAPRVGRNYGTQPPVPALGLHALGGVIILARAGDDDW